MKSRPSDENDRLDSSRDNIINKKKSGNYNNNIKRREMKKDPMEKAKEKMWESIVKETENEDYDDSSDDEH
jgi:hypothetical protein